MENRVGQYRIVRELGKGGMGVVYEALDEASGRTVVIKTLLEGAPDAAALRRFEREGRAAGAVSHENVVQVISAGISGQVPYIVFAHAAGGGLDHRLKKVGPVPWPEAARLGAGIARGLAAIHAAGLVHRDMKPANVLLSGDGVPKISDLGLVRLDAPSGVSVGGLTATGQLMGTLEYIAPEQAENSKGVDARADLYSFGATLHALVAGRPPFEGGGISLIKKHMMDPPPALATLVPGVAPALSALVLRLLAKDPAERPQTAVEVAAALDAIVAAAPRTAPAAVLAAAPTAAPPGRGRAIAAVGLAALAVAIAGAAAAWFSGSAPAVDPSLAPAPATGPAPVTGPAPAKLAVTAGRRWSDADAGEGPIGGIAVTADGARVIVATKRLVVTTADGAHRGGPSGDANDGALDLVMTDQGYLYASHADGIRRFRFVPGEPYDGLPMDTTWQGDVPRRLPGVTRDAPTPEVRAAPAPGGGEWGGETFSVFQVRGQGLVRRDGYAAAVDLDALGVVDPRALRTVSGDVMLLLGRGGLVLQRVADGALQAAEARHPLRGGCTLSLSPSRDAAFVGQEDGDVSRVGLVPGPPVAFGGGEVKRRVHRARVARLAISPDGRLGLSLDAQGGVRLWATDTLEPRGGAALDATVEATAIAWGRPDGAWFIVGFASGDLRRFDVAR